MANRNPINSYWPERLGRIRHSATFESPYLIFKIEDTFSDIDVQQGMVDVLHHLCSEYSLRLICLEGAQGAFSISDMKSVIKPNEIPLLRKEMKNRILSAPVYFAFTSDFPLILHGAEDETQYTRNRDALKLVSVCYSQINHVLDEFEKNIVRAKETIYSQSLLNFETATTQYETNMIELADFLRTRLWPRIQETRLPIDEFPYLAVLLRCLELERNHENHEFDRVNLETRRLIQDILTILDAPCVHRSLFERVVRARLKLKRREIQEFKKIPLVECLEEYRHCVAGIKDNLMHVGQHIQQGIRATTDMYSHLIDLASLCEVDIRRYPNLLRYAHYLHQARHIEVEKLYLELQQATELVNDTLFSNETERKVAKVWRAISGVQKLCRLEMEPAKIDHFIGEFGQISMKDLLMNMSGEDIPSKDHEDWRAAINQIESTLEKTNLSKMDLLIILLIKKFYRLEMEPAKIDHFIGEFSQISIKDLLMNMLDETMPSKDHEDWQRAIHQTENSLGEASLSRMGLLMALLIKFASNEISDYDHNNADWQKIEDLLKEENIQKLDILIELTNIFKPNSNKEIAIDRQMAVLYIDLALESAYRFYQLAPLRARTIAENTLRHMKELGVTEAAIISGGFLTNQICAVLEREAVSYVAIMPESRNSMITRKDYILKMQGDIVKQRSFIDELRERVSTDKPISTAIL